MEQELHQVVRDQQDQAQPVEAEGGWTERDSQKAGSVTDPEML